MSNDVINAYAQELGVTPEAFRARRASPHGDGTGFYHELNDEELQRNLYAVILAKRGVPLDETGDFWAWDRYKTFQDQQRKDELYADRFSYHNMNDRIPALKQYLRAEQNRVNQLPYAQYRGPTMATKSPILQHAHTLRDNQYAPDKSIMNNRMNELAARAGTYEGLTNNARGLIDRFLEMRDKEHRDSVLGRFNKSFRAEPGKETFAPQIDETYKGEFDKTEPEFKRRLLNYADVLQAKNKRSDVENTNVLGAIAEGEHHDRQKYLNALEAAGHADTGIANMKLEADRRNFNTQANEPRNQVNRLAAELQPHFNAEEMKERDNKGARDHALLRKAELEKSGQDIGQYVSNYNSRNEPSFPVEDALKAYGINDPADLNSRTAKTVPNLQMASKPAALQEAEKHYLNSELGHSSNLMQQLDKLMEGEDSRTQRIVKRAIEDNIASFDRDDREHGEHLTREIEGLANKYGQSGHNHVNYAHNLAGIRAAQQAERRRQQLLAHLDRSGQFEQFADKTRQMSAQVAAMRDRLSNQQAMDYMARKHQQGLNEFDSAQNALQRQYVDNLTRHNYHWPTAKGLDGYDVTPLNRNNIGYVL